MKRFLLSLIALVLAFASPAFAQPIYGGSTVTTPIDQRYQTANTTMRQVANRTHIHAYQSTGFTSITSRLWETSPVALTAVQPLYCNYYVNDNSGSPNGVETNAGAASTVGYAIEYPKGTYTTLTWGGQSTGTVADGATAGPDGYQLGFTIPANVRWWLWAFAANGTSMVYDSWSNVYDTSGGDCTQFNPGSFTPGTCSNNGGSSNAVFPCAILGLSFQKVWVRIGDSQTAAINDIVADPSGGQGFFGRPLARLVTVLNLGSPGDRATWFAASHAKRVALIALAGATEGDDSLCVNDIETGGGRTATQCLADRETIRALFSFPVWDTTITPYTTTTDGCLTATNQTPNANNAAKNTFNTAERAGIAASPGLLDIAAPIETSASNGVIPVLNGGVWLPSMIDSNGSTICLHPSSFGYQNPFIQFQVQGAVMNRGAQ